MKECPRCHSQVTDSTKYCNECGYQFSNEISELTERQDVNLDHHTGPLVIEPSEDDAALAFVYIAQYARSVRPDGLNTAGVLVDDCSNQYLNGISHLLNQKAIEIKKWYGHLGYIVTPEGSIRASAIIKSRLDQSLDTIKNLLASLPPKFVLFLLEEVVKSDNGMFLQPTSEIGYHDAVGQSSHTCLLNDVNVKILSDSFMRKLIRLRLAEKPHHYVSSSDDKNYGKRLEYHLAPEVLTFLEEYLKSSCQSSVPLFDDFLEAKHSLYHKLISLRLLDQEQGESLLETQGANKADLIRVFTKLESIKAVKLVPGLLTVVNITVFQDVIREEFFSPLVVYLLHGSQDETKKLPIRKPPEIGTGTPNSQIGAMLKSFLGELGSGEHH